MSTVPARSRRGYTWSDYRSWPANERWELIHGAAYAMSPAPDVRHQRVVRNLLRVLDRHFRGKPCELFVAPIDVKLSDADVVQPDLAVVCDSDKVRATHIEGAPTLVVEVLSPSTAVHDRTRKLSLYARSKVPEVWLVTPYPPTVELLLLDGENYIVARVFSAEETMTSPSFPSLKFRLMQLFDFAVEPDQRITMIREGRPEYGTPSRPRAKKP